LARLSAIEGLSCQRLSEWLPLQPDSMEAVSGELSSVPVQARLDTDVLLIDCLGALLYYYSVADVAFIGGSLVDTGGHNPVEALLAGTPVMHGPSVENFADLYAGLQAAGAACQVNGEAELAARLADWIGDQHSREQACIAGQAVVRQNQGALERVLTMLSRA